MLEVVLWILAVFVTLALLPLVAVLHAERRRTKESARRHPREDALGAVFAATVFL